MNEVLLTSLMQGLPQNLLYEAQKKYGKPLGRHTDLNPRPPEYVPEVLTTRQFGTMTALLRESESGLLKRE